MANFYPSTPGGRFKAARLRADMTQTEVAVAAGVKQSTVSEFEGGQTEKVKVSSLVPMCIAVAVTVEYVWTGARAARSADEDEAIFLLRGATDAERLQALKSLRGMLSRVETAAPVTKTSLALENFAEAGLASAQPAPRKRSTAGKGPGASSAPHGQKLET